MKQQLHVEYINTNLLNAAAYNPRSWDQKAISDLTESVKRFGLVDPIIVNNAPNRKNIVIGGHFRLKIAKDLGYTEVPVVYLNIPEEQKEKELNLRLNKNTGDWDYELLKAFNMDLLLDIGFDNEDLSSVWDEQLSVEDDSFDIDKEIKNIKVPQTKLGDVYKLGDHILICGDSTKICPFPQKVAFIYCDPPYNIRLNYNKGVGNTSKYGGKTNDNKSQIEFKAFLKQTIENALSSSKHDAHVFYWCDENHIGLLQELYLELGIDPQRVCLWIKNNQNPTPQLAFNKLYEACVYGTIGKPYLSPSVKNLNEVLNKEIGTGNRLPDDILDLFNIWLAKRIPGNEYEHPTQKPPSLHEKALRRCTRVGDTVLDLFGGSGSTLIACEQLKRKAILVEIEPVFCDLIIKRFEKLTGKGVIKV